MGSVCAHVCRVLNSLAVGLTTRYQHTACPRVRACAPHRRLDYNFGSGSGRGDPVLLGKCWYSDPVQNFCNKGHHWTELNEYINSHPLPQKATSLTNFGARPKVFPISNGEVLKQFPLIDETISHK